MAGNQNHQQPLDAMSDGGTSSTSNGNRSSLSWALSRLTGVLPPSDRRRDPASTAPSQTSQLQYNRTRSSRELGTDQSEPRRTYQRYGRSSTLDNIDPTGSMERSARQRVGSPFSDDDQPSSGISTPASYRTYTRTRSREYLSPSGSRCTSPVPVNGSTTNPVHPPEAAMNPIVQQLSTVLENGPLGTENENSPKPIRAAESAKIAVVTSLISKSPSGGGTTEVAGSQSSTAERKSRRVSRFLRPDFYDTPKDESSANQKRVPPSPSSLKSIPDPPQVEKYNPDAGLMALSSGNKSANDGRAVVLKPITSSAPANPPSSLQPILQARQNLIPIPQPVQPVASPAPTGPNVILKPVVEQHQPAQPAKNAQVANGHAEPTSPASQTSVPVTAPAVGQPIPAKVTNNGTKSSPKLSVRRQFEQLINLAAAQFRSSSPSKAPVVQPPPEAPVPAAAPVVTVPSAQVKEHVISPSEAISFELKQLEDEIKNTAAIKAQASARLDALKYEHALRSGLPPVSGGLPPPSASKPTIPAKPEFLTRPNTLASPSELPIPIEFQPFQYKGSNGTLREMSQMSSHARHARDTLSPPASSLFRSESNGRSPPVYLDGQDNDSVRFARVKRVEQSPMNDNCWTSDAMDTPGTPTDSYESSSVCSDLRGDQRADSGEDESVSERIFRKSFYTRFNEPSKMKHHHHRRSINSKEPTNPTDVVNESASNDPVQLQQQPMVRRSSQHRKSFSSRDESAEAVMVRKFLSSSHSESSAPFERERRLSATRRHQRTIPAELADSDYHRPVGSREPSVARSVKSDTHSEVAVTSPTTTAPETTVSSSGRESRSYLRSYSSRTFVSDQPPSLPTSPPADSYSSASLGRRSYYQPPTNSDHISSLPRRSNR